MNTTKIELARKNGIHNADLAWEASRVKAGNQIPFWVMCAFLEQETWGKNIWGHDVDANGYPKPFWGHGEVTKSDYLAYKKERDLGILRPDRFPRLGRRSQGVGPMQLTFWAFQDEADSEGGCWDVLTNMFVGARILAGYYDDAVARKITGEIPRWQYAALRWNGKDTYASDIKAKLEKWRDLIT